MEEITLREEIKQWQKDFAIYGNTPLERRASKLLLEFYNHFQ